MTGGSYQGGIVSATKSESNGRFYLSWTPPQVLTDALGRGSAPCEAAFMTCEGREYFIQAEACRERCAQLAADLNDARQQLREIAERKELRRKKRLERRARPDMPMKVPGVPWSRFDLGCPPDPPRE